MAGECYTGPFHTFEGETVSGEGWCYRTVDGNKVGPLTPAQFVLLAEHGHIRAGTAVRKGADGTWVTAEKVRGLLPAAMPPAAPPTPPAVPVAPTVASLAPVG